MQSEHEDLGNQLGREHEQAKESAVPEDACITWRPLRVGLEKLGRELHEQVQLENNLLHKRVLSG